MIGIPCTGVNPNRLYYCTSLSDISLDVDDGCVESNQLCDGIRDCPFGDDEWNCNTFENNNEDCTEANGYFECTMSQSNEFLATNSSSNVCIRFDYSCNAGEFETWDCPNQEDLAPATCNDNLRCMYIYMYIIYYIISTSFLFVSPCLMYV